ncbi:MAG: cytochrome c [Rhodospirillaceae bacterium]
MTHIRFFLSLMWAALALALAPPAMAQDADAVKRGEYVFHAAGCAGCHTDTQNKGALAAGGHALKTPFGTYYGPNITADKTHGIGNWSDADFIRALREGKSPAGDHYFPVFPYPSFTKMTDQDMRDLKAYIFSLPAVATPNKPHEINFPFGFRFSMIFWKILFFDEGAYRADPAQNAEWNRGAYLSNALSHCGECHTPRNFMGALKGDMNMAGTPDGPDNASVPNITPDPDTGIGKWSHQAIMDVLDGGMMPDGDFVGGAMTEVSENLAKISKKDRKAIAVYIKSLPPIRNKVTKK